VRLYPIIESELDSVAMLNSLATLFFSLGSSGFSIAFALWSGMFIESTPSEAAKQAMPVLICVFALVGCLFTGLGVWAWRRKGSELSKIKQHVVEQSSTKQPP
jgi:hypothetical protein